MAKLLKEKIISINRLAKGICRIDFQSEEVAQTAVPGQFINVRCSTGIAPLLRRPFSICDVDRKAHRVSFVFLTKSEATKALADKKEGEALDIIAPLGNGFEMGNHKRILTVGGGLGIFPLYHLLKESKAEYKGCLLGFRNRELVVMEENFREVSDALTIYTEDGSVGQKGLVSDDMKEFISSNGIEVVYACGPMAMLKNVAAIAQSVGVPCQVSIEERMACGIGACLVCACKARSDGEGSEFVYKHVCKDGPVFWAEELIF